MLKRLIHIPKNGTIWKFPLLLACMLVSTSLLFAQSKKITGIVSNSSGKPVENVAVVIKGTTIGTVTNGSGQYTISAQPNSVLIFSSIGFENKEEIVGSRSTINVKLKTYSKEIDAVVVIGYGTQRKVNLSGSVAVVSGKELINRPVPNVTSALQGVLPGVAITRGSGEPGAEGYGIRIRGFTSANPANALILVDGVEQDMNLLDPNDVESISVLKDASASAIYGARAAAGVVLVTTKQGNSGKTRINYNNYYGINITARQPERLNSWEEALLADEARFNATTPGLFNQEQDELLKNANMSYRPNPGVDRWDYFVNNDWVSEGMDKINHMQNHAVSISGGEQKMNYLLSGSYYKRDGVLRYGPDDNSRYNFKLNINTELNKYISLKFNANYIGSVVNENSFGTDQIIFRLYRSRTRQPVYTPPEDVTDQPFNGDLQLNAIDVQKNGGKETRNYETFTGRLALQVKNLVKGLTLDVAGWRNNNFYNAESNRRSLFWYGRSTATVRFTANVPNSISITKNKGYQNNLQAFLSYNLKWKNHNFTLLQGTQYEEYRKDEVSVSATNMPTNDVFAINFADPLNKSAGDGVQEWALASAFGRFNYNFDDKYLFEASYRYDGSSRLAPTNRWQLFPSLSAAWRVDQENFMQKFDFINNMKLRASWGQLGNGSVLGFYDHIALLLSGSGVIFNNNRALYYYQAQLASPEKTWETVEQTNFAVDLTMLESRLSITAEYYIKQNKNMLIPLNLPNIIGIAVGSFNIGQLKSWGTELDIKWRDRIGNLDYNVGFTISDNQNKLVKYDAASTINDGGVIGQLEGYPLNTVWGYKTGGYFQTLQEATDYKAKVSYPFFSNLAAGDIKYLDLNGDGVINNGGGTPTNTGDLVRLGATNARYIYGLNLALAWKGIDFSVFMQGVAARAFLINQEALSPLLNTADQPSTIHLDRWTPENPNAFFPRLYQTSAHNFRPSDKWVQNGSYLRLKNIQIGYTIPINKKYIRDLKIYVSGQDLWEKTEVLSIFDPEVGNNVGSTTYPFYRTVSFGLNLSF